MSTAPGSRKRCGVRAARNRRPRRERRLGAASWNIVRPASPSGDERKFFVSAEPKINAFVHDLLGSVLIANLPYIDPSVIGYLVTEGPAPSATDEENAAAQQVVWKGNVKGAVALAVRSRAKTPMTDRRYSIAVLNTHRGPKKVGGRDRSRWIRRVCFDPGPQTMWSWTPGTMYFRAFGRAFTVDKDRHGNSSCVEGLVHASRRHE